MRSDARRNLDSLLGAAAECFAEGGLAVSVDEIARRAGVGHGTVFRRFPTKGALVEAVLERELERVALVAQAALAEEDAWEAFAGFFRSAADAYARNRVLIEERERCRALPAAAVLLAAATELARRAQEAGALRGDLTAAEILELVPAASRFPDVILDGLRRR